MGEKYIIDSNVLIDAEAGNLSPAGMVFLKGIIDDEFIISFITYIEILGYKKVTKSTTEFILLSKVIEVNTEIINECIKIRKSRSIKMPDALIAATAVVYNYTLITNNTKDFRGINSLKIINPHNL